MTNFEAKIETTPESTNGSVPNIAPAVEVDPRTLLAETLQTGIIAGNLVVSQARRDELAKKVISFDIPTIDDILGLSREISLKAFGGLDTFAQVSMATAHVNGRKYADIFETEQKRRAFVQRTINKARYAFDRHKHPKLVDDEELESLYEQAVKKGWLEVDDTGATQLTKSGLAMIKQRAKRTGRNTRMH